MIRRAPTLWLAGAVLLGACQPAPSPAETRACETHQNALAAWEAGIEDYEENLEDLALAAGQTEEENLQEEARTALSTWQEMRRVGDEVDDRQIPPPPEGTSPEEWREEHRTRALEELDRRAGPLRREHRAAMDRIGDHCEGLG